MPVPSPITTCALKSPRGRLCKGEGFCVGIFGGPLAAAQRHFLIYPKNKKTYVFRSLGFDRDASSWGVWAADQPVGREAAHQLDGFSGRPGPPRPPTLFDFRSSPQHRTNSEMALSTGKAGQGPENLGQPRQETSHFVLAVLKAQLGCMRCRGRDSRPLARRLSSNRALADWILQKH